MIMMERASLPLNSRPPILTQGRRGALTPLNRFDVSRTSVSSNVSFFC